MPFYRILRMGCGVSKIDANGVATPNRILPNFPNRRRHKECIPSKKEPLLLMHEIPDEDHANNRHSVSAPKCDDNVCCVTSEGSNEKRVAKIMAIVQEEEKNNEGGGVHENEGEKDDNNDDDLRAINKLRVDEEDGDVYPGSPSFRVYFTDTDVESNKNDGNNKVGLKDVTSVAATISSTKECVVKEEKKEIRKKSFRNVLPRNLLNVRSSSNSSTRSTHHHSTHHPA